jgi:hypothetical protein
MSTPNILTRKSVQGPLPHCKSKAEQESFIQLGPIVNAQVAHLNGMIFRKEQYLELTLYLGHKAYVR